MMVRCCFCGDVVVVFVWGMVVILRFVGGVVVFCGGVVVSLRLCFCGGCSCVFVVAFLRFVGGVVVFCGYVSVIVFLWWCFSGERHWRREL